MNEHSRQQLKILLHNEMIMQKQKTGELLKVPRRIAKVKRKKKCAK